MSISKFYKVEVQIPDSVWGAFGHTSEYDRLVSETVKGSNSSGSDSYSCVYEWAEFSSLEKAQECERRLLDVIYKLQARLI